MARPSARTADRDDHRRNAHRDHHRHKNKLHCRGPAISESQTQRDTKCGKHHGGAGRADRLGEADDPLSALARWIGKTHNLVSRPDSRSAGKARPAPKRAEDCADDSAHRDQPVEAVASGKGKHRLADEQLVDDQEEGRKQQRLHGDDRIASPTAQQSSRLQRALPDKRRQRRLAGDSFSRCGIHDHCVRLCIRNARPPKQCQQPDAPRHRRGQTGSGDVDRRRGARNVSVTCDTGLIADKRTEPCGKRFGRRPCRWRKQDQHQLGGAAAGWLDDSTDPIRDPKRIRTKAKPPSRTPTR